MVVVAAVAVVVAYVFCIFMSWSCLAAVNKHTFLYCRKIVIRQYSIVVHYYERVSAMFG